jgi:hypothetical protein
MNPEIHLRIGGALLLALAAAHAHFPGRFKWREELQRLSLINRQMFQVHVLFIVMVVIGCGLLMAVFTAALLEPTPLSRLLLAGMAAFWGLRFFVQIFVYDSRLWRGQPFHTAVHVLFCGLWGYLTLALLWALRAVSQAAS